MNDQRSRIAERIASALPKGSYVNLGIGIPTIVANYVRPEDNITFQTENGILGFRGLEVGDNPDPDLIDAGKQPIKLLPGGSYFDHGLSFAMVRGGHIDVTVLGAFEVSIKGDLANWSDDPRGILGAVGGAMDLAVGARSVLVAMTHTTVAGTSKLLRECSLPLTASGVVTRVYTEYGTFRPTGEAFEVVEVCEGVDRKTIVENTAAPVTFAYQ